MKKNKKALQQQKRSADTREIKRPKKLPPFKPDHLPGILLGIIAILLYSNTFNSDYVLDDAAVITVNGFVQKGIAGIPDILKTDIWHFFGLKLGYYRPLSLITFAIEKDLWGNDPHISHIINVLIYAFSAYLLFLVLSRAFRSFHPLMPFLIGLLFITHPVHTEVVANIKSRDELLSYLNMLLMLWFSYKYFDQGKISSLLLSLLFYYLALLSKETALMGLALLPAFLYFTENVSIASAIKRAIPLTLILVLFLIQKKMMLGTLTGTAPIDIVNYPYTDSSIKFPTVSLLYAFSLRLMLFPHPLRYDYSYNQIPGVDFANFGALGGLALFIAGAILILKYYKTRSPIIFGLLVLYINLTPGLAFTIVRGGIFAERLLFLPSLGLAIILVTGSAHLLKSDLAANEVSYFSKIKSNQIITGLFIVFALAYSAKTFTRNFAWKDEPTLYKTDLKTGINSTQNLRHYGSEMMKLFLNEKQDTAKRNYYMNEAKNTFYRAITIHPGFGEIYNQLGVIHKEGLGNIDSGLYYFNKSITMNPGFALGYYNLGSTYQALGQYNVASYYYNESLKYNPNYPDAIKQKEYLKTTYGLDVQINPLSIQNPDAPGTEKNSAYYYNTGNYFASRGDYQKALENFQTAVNMDPNNVDAMINLGNCYGMLQLYDQSINTLLQVVNKYPQNSRAVENLATSYKNAGNNAKAEEYTRMANRLRGQ